MRFFYLLVILSLFLSIRLLGQPLTANAGANKAICYGQVTVLGGAPSASGGTVPYTYAWEPSANVSSPTAANPTAVGLNVGTWFRLVVTDKDGVTDTSFVYVDVNQIYTFNAGIDTGYCYGQETGVKIGGPNNNNTSHTFSWSPSLGLDNPTATNPIATPSIQTTYTLVVSDGICPNNKSFVTVIPFMPPAVDAGLDTSIFEGQVFTILGTGSHIIDWTPKYNIKYDNTLNPDVWPIEDTTYYIYTEDSHGCSATDSIRVRVIEKDSLYFYSAFTPNGDGDNDVFYVGNLKNFPDNNLKVYNRYGKVIFNATNYANDWDGNYLGQKVPDGVYFYILDDGVSRKYKGTVTILR